MKRGNFVPDARIKRTLPRIVLASILMGCALAALAPMLGGWFGQGASILWRGLGLAVLVGGGLLVYGVCALGLRAVEIRQFRRYVRRG